MRPNFIQQAKNNIADDIYTPAFGTITGDITQAKMWLILDTIFQIIGDYRSFDEPLVDVIQGLIDAPTEVGGIEFLGLFSSYSDAISSITEYKTGDVFVVKTNTIPSVTQLYIQTGSEFMLIAQFQDDIVIEGLNVKKNPNNFDRTRLEQYDFCEGWLSPNLFVKGLWKGNDDPTLLQMQDKDKWSNFIEIE